ncbi:hypothetical protein ACSFA3_16065 [Variovorax sp. RHLX14]|uniref:hypothetical protein n=1 Tax=Variovorax sp. RHLX14 TaxID=1259731 RepID=UPI003F486684
MNEPTFASEIKWHDRRMLIRSFVVGMVFFIFFCGLMKRAEPPEGYVFERLPSITGIYKCCEAGGRYSRSWIGHKTVACTGFTYYPLFGTNRNDCGFKSQLDGQSVEVVETYLPSFTVSDPVVIKMKTQTTTYIDLSDKKIRDLWISGSYGDATFGFTLGMIFHIFQLLYFNRKSRNLRNKS